MNNLIFGIAEGYTRVCAVTERKNEEESKQKQEIRRLDSESYLLRFVFIFGITETFVRANGAKMTIQLDDNMIRAGAALISGLGLAGESKPENLAKLIWYEMMAAAPAKARKIRGHKPREALPDGFPDGLAQADAVKYWGSVGRPDLAAKITSIMDQFRDHNMKHGNVMADWPAAWRTWYRNAVKFEKAPLTLVPNSGRYQSRYRNPT